MSFGKIIGRVSEWARSQYGSGRDVVFSVKGMTNAELIKICNDGPEVINTMRPILLEFDHYLFKQIFYKPTMTPGEVHAIMSNHLNLAIEAAGAEMTARQKDGAIKKVTPKKNGN